MIMQTGIKFEALHQVGNVYSPDVKCVSAAAPLSATITTTITTTTTTTTTAAAAAAVVYYYYYH